MVRKKGRGRVVKLKQKAIHQLPAQAEQARVVVAQAVVHMVVRAVAQAAAQAAVAAVDINLHFGILI